VLSERAVALNGGPLRGLAELIVQVIGQRHTRCRCARLEPVARRVWDVPNLDHYRLVRAPPIEPDRVFPRPTGKFSIQSLGRSTPVERFLRRENIKRYRRLLRVADDDAERRRILLLLKEEEQKTAADESKALPMFQEA